MSHTCVKRTDLTADPYVRGVDYILTPRMKGWERHYRCVLCGDIIGWTGPPPDQPEDDDGL